MIKNYSDISNLEVPDFFKSGLMPLAHEMYNEMLELTNGQLTISLPHWFRGPFGVATHLRGTNELLMDLYLNPEFVHELMDLITRARKIWCNERAKLVSSRIEPGVLSNDEVNSPALSPKLYKNFILPYEKLLCDFHGGISYWHSCGNITGLLKSISEIEKLDILHIGPWTNAEKAKEIFTNSVSYEICLMPTRDVYSSHPEEMRHKIQKINRIMKGSAYTIRADGFQVVNDLERNIRAIKQWRDIAITEMSKNS
jgi:uroporphyrinogen-III decarboxylase